MFNFRTVALATTSVTSGIVLMALPTPASANTVRCEFVASAPVTVNNTTSAAITNTTAVENAIASPEGQRRLANSPPECRSAVAAASLQQSRLNPTGMVAPNTTVSVTISIPRILPSPAAPAQPATLQPPAAPANTGTAGPGATIDGQIAALNRRIAALEAGGGDPTEIAALRADVASLRAERAQAGRPVVRNTTVVRRETRVINQGLNAKDRGELDLWTRTRGSFSSAITRLFGTGPDNPETREREDGIIGGLQATDAEHTRKIGVLENLLSWTYWALWTLLPLLLVGLAVFFLARSGLAKKTDHDDTKADATTVADQSKRIDDLDARLTDTEQQVGKKIVALAPDLVATVAGMKEGEEITTPVVVEGVAHEVVLVKGIDDEVFIKSGVEGHPAGNAVKVNHLTRTLRKAAYDDRLNVKASV
jgi:hypothetical protein